MPFTASSDLMRSRYSEPTNRSIDFLPLRAGRSRNVSQGATVILPADKIISSKLVYTRLPLFLRFPYASPPMRYGFRQSNTAKNPCKTCISTSPAETYMIRQRLYFNGLSLRNTIFIKSIHAHIVFTPFDQCANAL